MRSGTAADDRKANTILPIALILGLVLLLAVLSAVYIVTLDSGDASERLHVDGPSELAGNETVVDYASLTDAQQETFRSALQSEDGVAEIPEDVDSHVWTEHDVVRYRNQSYVVTVSVP